MRFTTNSSLIALFLVSSVLLPLFGQTGGPRYALVIGNGNYTELGKLKNPVNDANDIAATLKELGFQVNLLTDADLPTMEDAVVSLGNQLATSKDSIGFFFYAGHGVQSSGINYLIPADAHIASESFLRTKAIAAQEMLDVLQQTHNSLNVVVLDACRDNPFSWGRSATRGLSVIGSQPPGSIVVYATSAGSTAEDGTGRNEVFTSELLKQLKTPGLEINEMFKRTGAAVQNSTSGRQVPAVYNQYFGNAYLAGGVQAAPSQPSSGPATSLTMPTVSITHSYGSLIVSALTAGELFLDGIKMADLPAGAKATLGNIDVGARLLAVHYPDGQTEQQSVTVTKGEATMVKFVYNRTGTAKTIISGITLNHPLYGLQLGPATTISASSLQLTATVTPPDANQTVAWASSNPAIATVSSIGLVTGLSVGTAKIFATASDKQTTAHCWLVVLQNDGEGFLRYFCNDPASYGAALAQGVQSSNNTVDLTATATQPITVQIKKVSGSSGQGAGIWFLCHPWKNYYEFMIATDGQYRFRKCVDGKVIELVGWTTSSAIIRGNNQVNTISIWQPATGQISISINGTTVVNAFPDAASSAGIIAFYYSNATPNSSVPENFPETPEDIRYRVISPFIYPSVSND